MQNSDNITVKPERINELAQLIQTRLTSSMKEIDSINLQARLLSINAQVEAARAGDAGRAFGIVASSMGELSESTSVVAKGLTNGVQSVTNELADISKRLSFEVRGQRLTDLALNNIELIDRNLYERTCDVRWWATDSSLVEACEDNENQSKLDYASKRLGVILNAYTVYFDLVLCDTNGKVLTNGRPKSYASSGKDVSQTTWFKQAIRSATGDDYGFQTVHESSLTDNKRILAYSCGVRTGGDANGDIIGVLGIFFNWGSLAQTIVHRSALSEEEWAYSRALIVDKTGLILADTDEYILRSIEFEGMDKLFENERGFMQSKINGTKCLICHAHSPGYETYKTDWYSLIIQKV
ncbi:MAG: cache domain-containing protein [Balneolaceae bacterium]|nr:cache domain-containing protein [Balneolaceae bacterium]